MKKLVVVALAILGSTPGMAAGSKSSPSPSTAGPVGLPPLAAVQGGDLGVPLPLLPADNWWNLAISNAPVDPASAQFIAHVAQSSPVLHPDLGGEVSQGSDEIYGMPYAVVDGSQTRVAVEFLYSDESDGVDHETDTSFPFYPIPPEARTEAHWIECGPPGTVDLRSTCDRHLLMVDKDNNELYELYNVWYDGVQWHAGSGAFFDLDSNDRRPEGWTSADAAGLAIMPGLIRYDEVYGPDPIEHALRVTVRDTNGHVWPASHTAGSSSGALPMGARLRLKANVDISGFDPALQKIFQAMKTYGLIVADNGTDLYVQGTFDTRWDNGILNPAFHSMEPDDFEVVQLGWRPATSDFDGDGKPDLVWRNSVTGQNEVWFMDGHAHNGTGSLESAGTAWVLAGSADFDLDGDADLVWRNGSTGQNAIWWMNGTTRVGVSYTTPVNDPNWRIASVSDFDGDLYPDLIWRNYSTGANVVWFMQGANRSSGASLQSLKDFTWDIAGSADFDHDGQTDLLWRRNTNGRNGVWIMDGLVRDSVVFLNGVSDTNWKIQAIADMDGDSNADLVWRHATSGAVALWYMNGTTYLNAKFTDTVADQNWQIKGPK